METIEQKFSRFQQWAQSIGVTELARRTNLPKTTVFDAMRKGRKVKYIKTLDSLFKAMDDDARKD